MRTIKHVGVYVCKTRQIGLLKQFLKKKFLAEKFLQVVPTNETNEETKITKKTKKRRTLLLLYFMCLSINHKT